MPREYEGDAELIRKTGRLLGRPPAVLNLASGPGKVDGWVNVDKVAYDGVDLVCDLDMFPWPFEDGSFDVILCNHYIEHAADITKTMEEMHRVGRPGCMVVVRTPYFANYESFRDPTHRWHLTWESLDYFTGKFGVRYTMHGFEPVYKELSFAERWRNPGYYIFRVSPRFYEKNFAHVFPGTWLRVVLKVVK